QIHPYGQRVGLLLIAGEARRDDVSRSSFTAVRERDDMVACNPVRVRCGLFGLAQKAVHRASAVEAMPLRFVAQGVGSRMVAHVRVEGLEPPIAASQTRWPSRWPTPG